MARVVVVTGPPCAGKSTHIAEHAVAGDVVVDFDRLAEALDPGPARPAQDFAPIVRAAAFAARAAAIARVLAWQTDGAIWIVDSKPSPASLTAYARAQAEIVVVDPGKAVCLERAALLRPAMVPFVHRWYAEADPPAPPRWGFA